MCGSDITKARINGTCLLDRLSKRKEERNELVHSKSTVWSNDMKKFREQMLPKKGKIAAEDAFDLIRLLLAELERVDRTNWWFFQKDAYSHYIKKP